MNFFLYMGVLGALMQAFVKRIRVGGSISYFFFFDVLFKPVFCVAGSWTAGNGACPWVPPLLAVARIAVRGSLEKFLRAPETVVKL